MIELERVSKEAKRTEKHFWDKFETVKGEILGALFDAISYSLGAPDPKLSALERMADFSEMGVKLAEGLGLDGSTFLKALAGNSSNTVDTALQASPVAVALLALLEAEGGFEGSTSQLYSALRCNASDLNLSNSFPRSAATLTRALRPLITDLREIGVDFAECQDSHSKQTRFKIKKSDWEDILS